MSDDTKRFSPPPLKRGESLAMMLAFCDGKAYAAPLGSSVYDPDPWIEVHSLEFLARRLGVEWKP